MSWPPYYDLADLSMYVKSSRYVHSRFCWHLIWKKMQHPQCTRKIGTQSRWYFASPGEFCPTMYRAIPNLPSSPIAWRKRAVGCPYLLRLWRATTRTKPKKAERCVSFYLLTFQSKNHEFLNCCNLKANDTYLSPSNNGSFEALVLVHTDNDPSITY